MRDLGVDGGRVIGTPGAKPPTEQVLDDKPLGDDKTAPFRAVAARANYLSADRPGVQFAAKGACRWMATPTELAMSGLERI